MLIRSLIFVLLCGTLHAQEPAAPPDGTLIRAKVTKKCSTQKIKPGDEIVLKVTDDVRAPSGATLLPRNTRLVGHVREVQAFKKGAADARLFFVVEYAELKHSRMNLNARVDSLELHYVMSSNYSFDKLPNPVPGGVNIDPTDIKRNGADTYSRPPASLGEIGHPSTGPVYRLAHIEFASSNGSSRKDILFSRRLDIELTPEDAVIILKQLRD